MLMELLQASFQSLPSASVPGAPPPPPAPSWWRLAKREPRCSQDYSSSGAADGPRSYPGPGHEDVEGWRSEEWRQRQRLLAKATDVAAILSSLGFGGISEMVSPVLRVLVLLPWHCLAFWAMWTICPGLIIAHRAVQV